MNAEQALSAEVEAKKAQLASMIAARPPQAAEPSEETIVIGVQAVARPGLTGFARAGRFWPSGSVTIVRASLEAFEELRAESMVTTIEMNPADYDVALLPFVELPATRRDRKATAPVVTGQEKARLDTLEAEKAKLYESAVSYSEVVAGFDAEAKRTKTVLEALYRDFKPDSPIPPLERAKVEAEAWALKAAEARKAWDAVSRAHDDIHEEIEDMAKPALARAIYGLAAWKAYHADDLAKIERLQGQLAQLTAKVTSGAEARFAIPEDVRADFERRGMSPITPANIVTTGTVLGSMAQSIRSPGIAAHLARTEEDRRAALTDFIGVEFTKLEKMAYVTPDMRLEERSERLKNTLARNRHAFSEFDLVAKEIDHRQAEAIAAYRAAPKRLDPNAPGGERLATKEEIAIAKALPTAAPLEGKRSKAVPMKGEVQS